MDLRLHNYYGITKNRHLLHDSNADDGLNGLPEFVAAGERLPTMKRSRFAWIG